MIRFYEHHKRSLVKTLSFRILVMFFDFFIIVIITKRYDIALGVLLFSNFSSTVLYFFHERIWNNINWGKQNQINTR
ncbi:hypothetical protein A2767_05610 [Candidatus Roizmanbacteria bacterium RIFCSPHIGHO2_01_FULL_35_10]|uniref:DUF2061 domain-containing protein n=1 Tax=Candidatus Roizmanbacteria bacterium RIFCSPLOWO2_01_FULL_35_13 TaxID=1802055 RepID=A0A1F7IBN4_9BACT|nr:MAG: hypothetical protein A2767_05610 [Candidatus Roizmanbacteria bacterium RIFCSPHIGHO2_01_FULL_35_10]OGK40769.1 MAG: hypothetical protein A3A74_04080 [Candidatus Roizmanbacteria bacterium RIFCSPLOWO2_01_FULL_35_13]